MNLKSENSLAQNLVRAREYVQLNIEEAAKKLGVKPHILKQIESGEKIPTYNQLTKASKTYSQSIFDFYQDTIPQNSLPDHRKTPNETNTKKSLDYYKALRRARNQREVLLFLDETAPEFMSFSKKELPKFNLDVSSEVVGEKLRDFIGISNEMQLGAKGEHKALQMWIDAMTEVGILVIQFSKVENIRGFSISERPFSVIGLNGGDSPKGRIFTVLHELAHLSIRKEAMCDLSYSSYAREEDRVSKIEKFCDEVAAATSMPRDLLYNFPEIESAKPNSQWSIAKLKPISNKINISIEALLIRLISLGKANFSNYRKIIHKPPTSPKKEGGNPPPYQTKTRNLGKAYVKSVIDALEQGFISDLDAADYLDTKCEKLKKFNEYIS